MKKPAKKLAENSHSEPTPARKGRGGGRPFKRGQSGNPGGRPRGLTAVRLLAKEHTSAALKVLVEALESPDERIRIQAAAQLLDRGWGKPSSEIDVHVTTQQQVQSMSTPELEQVVSATDDEENDE